MVPERGLLSASALTVAPLLLGASVVSTVGGARVGLRITEVEAYEGDLDPASHAFRGPTGRNAVMFGPAGHLYCYFVYGMHWCANVVCGESETAAAVLLRAGQITEGEAAARDRTPAAIASRKLASGPARLARALGLNGAQTGVDLLNPRSEVRLVGLAPETAYVCGPRVGVAAAAEQPWRFWLPGEPTVSAYRAGGKNRVRATRQTDPS